MAKIESLPTLERPREKAFHYGIDTLSDHELIAILIGSGTTDSSAIDIAYRMLQENNGLFYLVQKPISDLLNYKGIGNATAVKIIAAFEIAKRFNSLKMNNNEEPISIDKIYDKYKHLIGNSIQEHMYLIVLNGKKKVIHEVNLYKGNESAVNCSWKQIIQQVLIHNGKYFYIIHNHPSGDPNPSQEDINFTSQLIRESQKLHILLLDHLIISNNGYFSFLNSSENCA
ncbi:MAG: DNA repair protein RadC [Bacilli bacterium]|nr:DNA repair protein RadC [Bacilli bacterium]